MQIPATGPIQLESATHGIATIYGGVRQHAITEYYRKGTYVADWAKTKTIPTSGTVKWSDYRGTAPQNIFASSFPKSGNAVFLPFNDPQRAIASPGDGAKSGAHKPWFADPRAATIHPLGGLMPTPNNTHRLIDSRYTFAEYIAFTDIAKKPAQSKQTISATVADAALHAQRNGVYYVHAGGPTGWMGLALPKPIAAGSKFVICAVAVMTVKTMASFFTILGVQVFSGGRWGSPFITHQRSGAYTFAGQTFTTAPPATPFTLIVEIEINPASNGAAQTLRCYMDNILVATTAGRTLGGLYGKDCHLQVAGSAPPTELHSYVCTFVDPSWTATKRKSLHDDLMAGAAI